MKSQNPTNKFKSIRANKGRARVVFGTDVKWCYECVNYTPHNHNRTSGEWTCAICGTVNGHKPA